MGVEIRVEGLTKSFGKQVIWQDVSLTLPSGEISVLLGPSGTGKSVFLKHLVGLLKPNRGHIYVDGKDVPHVPEKQLYEIRKLFGVLFQDGALFGSMNIFDNVAFPLREHTKKGESEIRNIVMEKLEMVGLLGAERKLPGEISGGMRKRAGLARALVLDPEVILFDEPDSGLDPVRVAYLNQLIVDLNAQIGATMLIVTHDIGTARTVPDNIGLIFRRELVMFGPREQLLTSDNPAVQQFLNGRMEGPIGMAEEKDAALVQEEMSRAGSQPQRPGGVGPKGAGSEEAVPSKLRPSSVRVIEHEPAPDLVDSEPSVATRAAIAIERDVAPDEGPVLELRQPVDPETGERLDRPSAEHDEPVETTGTAADTGDRAAAEDRRTKAAADSGGRHRAKQDGEAAKPAKTTRTRPSARSNGGSPDTQDTPARKTPSRRSAASTKDEQENTPDAANTSSRTARLRSGRR